MCLYGMCAVGDVGRHTHGRCTRFKVINLCALQGVCKKTESYVYLLTDRTLHHGVLTFKKPTWPPIQRHVPEFFSLQPLAFSQPHISPPKNVMFQNPSALSLQPSANHTFTPEQCPCVPSTNPHSHATSPQVATTVYRMPSPGSEIRDPLVQNSSIN
jgi:hypothetical protein